MAIKPGLSSFFEIFSISRSFAILWTPVLSSEAYTLIFDIKSKIKSWQNIIAYVPQKIFLVDDTIENNIALGEKNDIIDRKKLKISAKKSGLDLDTMFYRGGKTLVGESGVRLSSGQIQRIGIARALYHDPDIIFLDEATSQLDYQTERKIMEDLKFIKGKKTLIIISHRETINEYCDKIIKI